jgi:Tol biopolymer transport system component
VPLGPPDGSKVAFRSTRGGTDADIWVMNADDSNQQNLTTGESSAQMNEEFPAWSPDGTFIAFVQVTTGADIAILRVSGANTGQITTIPLGISQLYPEWSPDGRYIALSSNHGARFEIYTARPDGRGVSPWTDSVVPGSFAPGWLRRP